MIKSSLPRPVPPLVFSFSPLYTSNLEPLIEGRPRFSLRADLRGFSLFLMPTANGDASKRPDETSMFPT